MKVAREDIKSIGLSVVYEPNTPTDVNLDIILVHGLGGHPVRTWLHTPARTAPAKKVSSTDLASPKGEPTRALSLRYLASPNLKKGNTLRKPRTGRASSPQLRGLGSPFRPRSVDFSDVTGGSDEEFTVSRSGRLPRRGSRRDRRAQPLRQSPPREPKPQVDRWTDDEKAADGTLDLGTFWPTDLLPDLCCDARIFTWGFRTRMADGMLVPGQLDIFSRGRSLLNDVNDLLASYREHGQRRELVFVAHGTGGIIVKEMLRLAYSYEDTHNEPLLASIAGIVFIGCPLRDSNNGTMVEAMKSMGATATGVEIHDHVLHDLLGGDPTLAHEGRDAFEGVRHEFGFQVKTYRETIIVPPVDDTLLPWVALALRRDSESLEGAKEESDYIEADHLNMCRFSSAGNDGYRSIASFLLKLAHHQLRRTHHLTPKEEACLRLLAAPGSSRSQPSELLTRNILPPDIPSRKAPPWLLRHPAFKSWYHRNSPQDRHKVLWLRGPIACGKSELLSSLISHISTEWSPINHSSAIITAVAEGEPLLESIIQKSDGKYKKHDGFHSTSTTTTTTTTPPHHTSVSSSSGGGAPTSGPTHETATPLRTILQQLWAHDPRLRNLVGELAKASSLPPRVADSCAEGHQPQPQLSEAYFRRPSSKSGPGGDAAAAHGIYNSNTRAQRRGYPAGAASKEEPADRSPGKSSINTGGADDIAAADDDDGGRPPGQSYLEDSRVVSFFLEDYLRLELPQTRAQASSEGSRAAEKGPLVKVKGIATTAQAADGDKYSADPNNNNNNNINNKTTKTTGPATVAAAATTETTTPTATSDPPGTRRIFIFVDIAPTTPSATARDLLWCLTQLAARRPSLSICAASADLPQGMAIRDAAGAYADGVLLRRKHIATTAAAAAAAAAGAMEVENEDDDEMMMLTVDVPTSNAEDVATYIEATLLPDIEDRALLAAKLADRSRGVMFWLEHAVAIVNDASEDGVSGEIVCSMLDDIAPESSRDNNPPVAAAAPGAAAVGMTGLSPPSSRGRSGSSSSVMAQDPGQARLDDLYAWKLRRLSAGEARAALVLMQWVMLAPEAVRLNELLVAMRLTMLVWPQGGGSDIQGQGGADLGVRALDIEPPLSLRDLRRRPAGGDEVPSDSPSQFWRWARRISQGLVKLEGETRSTTSNTSNKVVSSEPLGLQRVVPAHESVRKFFLEGRGFQILNPAPSPSNNKTKPAPPPPTTEQLIDTSYYVLLHTCLVYLNMTDFDSLSRSSSSNTASQVVQPVTPSEPPSEAEEESTRLHRRNTDAQRALVTSSYPLLRYTVDNLTFHLLRPRALRYFPPQARLLRLLTADGCRIWRRWTRLLGIPETTTTTTTTDTTNTPTDVPAVLLAKARARPSAAALLRPVYGASFRLERVLRRACKTAREQAAAAQAARARARRARLQRQRSARSLKSAAGAGGGWDKVPPTPRTPPRTPPPRPCTGARSGSEQSMVFALVGDDALKAQWLVPRSPRSPRLRADSVGSLGSSPMSNPASPGVLVGIQEV